MTLMRDGPQPTRDAAAQPRALPALQSAAVVFGGDRTAQLQTLSLDAPSADDLIVDTEVSAISMGTEKLFWTGEMPPFPGMGYPLVPGYETVGRVRWSGRDPSMIGERVFVPGSKGFKDAFGLFGGAASRLVVHRDRVYPIQDIGSDDAVLLSLAATAYHALDGGEPPDLIVGFGVLGRLLLRLTRALGHAEPAVWETNPARAKAEGVSARVGDEDPRKDYRSIYDASGCSTLLDQLVSSLSPQGTIVLAGFYPGAVQFQFAPAFMKEVRLRIAAEYQPNDMAAVLALIAHGKLSLSGLVTHTAEPNAVPAAYETAFTDPSCLKMLLDWRHACG